MDERLRWPILPILLGRWMIFERPMNRSSTNKRKYYCWRWIGMRLGYFIIIPTATHIIFSRNTRSNRAFFDLITVPVTRHFTGSESSVCEKNKIKNLKVMVSKFGNCHASLAILTLLCVWWGGRDARSIAVFELQARN